MNLQEPAPQSDATIQIGIDISQEAAMAYILNRRVALIDIETSELFYVRPIPGSSECPCCGALGTNVREILFQKEGK